MTHPLREGAPWRAIDASLNRAAEGLRVVEDYLRFGLDDPHLSRLCKQIRHDLGKAASRLPAPTLAGARDSRGDVGAPAAGSAVDCDAETQAEPRISPQHVCRASLKRVEQALRSIEEFGKLVDPDLAEVAQQLRFRTYTLEKAIETSAAAIQSLADARLCVLIDGAESASAFGRLVELLVGAGTPMLQLRDKSLCDRDLTDRAKALVACCRGSKTLAIVNDRADIAAAAGADGVHVGQDDLPIAAARSLLGPDTLIGVSTHNLAQAREAVLAGANYLGAGPSFPSVTKRFDTLAGPEYLREVAAEVSLPTFAIGGIGPQNLAAVLATGIDRVAVSSAVVGAADPAAAVRGLLAQLGQQSTHSNSS